MEKENSSHDGIYWQEELFWHKHSIIQVKYFFIPFDRMSWLFRGGEEVCTSSLVLMQIDVHEQ